MAATIKDISRLAEVSTATVSKVLNGDYSKVSAETRDRIMKVADELDYRPNLLARGLVSKKLRVLGLIVPDISNPFYGDMLRGITDEATRFDYHIMIANADNLAERQLTSIQTMGAYNAAGILLIGGVNDVDENLAALKRLRIPYVCMENYVEGLEYCVYVDDYVGSMHAVNYLIERGHRRIACISGYSTPNNKRDGRTIGYEEALRQHGIEVDPYLMEFGSYTFDTGYRKALQLLSRDIPFTAIACGNDLIAMGAFKAIRDHHLQIPQDISLVGFDDLLLATALEPRLTTVKQPAYEMGVYATSMLLARIEKRPIAQKVKRFEPILVERDTVSIRSQS